MRDIPSNDKDTLSRYLAVSISREVIRGPVLQKPYKFIKDNQTLKYWIILASLPYYQLVVSECVPHVSYYFIPQAAVVAVVVRFSISYVEKVSSLNNFVC